MDDLVVIGGGAMGLFTAYHASGAGKAVTVLEAGRIGDPATASYGLTRSYRADYLDPVYARLADEARRLWEAFERETGVRALVRCGCLNIASAAVTPELGETYAELSHATMSEIGLATEALDGDALHERYPYLDADLGRMAVEAGVVDLVAVRGGLVAALAERGATVVEGAAPAAISASDDGFTMRTAAGEEYEARALVIAAGHGTNGVLSLLDGSSLEVPISRDRPSEAKYVTPADPEPFTAPAMPVVAYLDTGIYCHPIVPGLTDAVKIGYYNPPDMPRRDTDIDSVAAFVERCMPGLRGAPMRDVEVVDQCDYDLVADDEFVLGPVPGVPGAAVGVGWRGTGYKFAPWVGRVLAELSVQGGTVYDIARFSPARFERVRT